MIHGIHTDGILENVHVYTKKGNMAALKTDFQFYIVNGAHR